MIDFQNERCIIMHRPTMSSSRRPFRENYAPNISSPRLSLKKVNELLLKRPEEIVLEMCNTTLKHGFGLDNYMKCETIGQELATALIKLFEKAFRCSSLKSKTEKLVDALAKSTFLHKTVYNSLSSYDTDLIRSLINTFSMMIQINVYVLNEMEAIMDKLELYVKCKSKDAELLNQYETSLGREREKALAKMQQRPKTYRGRGRDQMPPTDFTEMSIIPTLGDILSDQAPFLCKNITNGAYPSVYHYLDTQFRLLREDFTQPIRTGICKLREIVESTHTQVPEIQNGR